MQREQAPGRGSKLLTNDVPPVELQDARYGWTDKRILAPPEHPYFSLEAFASHLVRAQPAAQPMPRRCPSGVLAGVAGTSMQHPWHASARQHAW